MKRNFVRNLILKTFAYSFILSALPYSYFLWHAKQGVDAYLVTRDFDVKLDYSWLWINQDGEVYLEDVRIFKTRRSPIIKAPRLKISFPSIFDLLDSREQVVYKTYPSQIQISVSGARTSQPIVALNMFGIPYKTQHPNLFFPAACRSEDNLNLPDFVFDLSGTFKIQQTADIAQVNFKFKDAQLATVKGSFNINQLFETGVNTAYLSDIKVNLNDLTWLQQNTQACLEKLKLGRNKLTIFYRDFLEKNANDENLLLDKKANEKISDFFYKPESIDIEFDIREGITYSQIDFYPAYDFQQRVGLSIRLNQKNIGHIFNGKIDIAQDENSEIENTSNGTNSPSTRKVKNSEVFISKSKRSLSRYLGSKIKLNFYSGQTQTGYLESIGRDQIIIKKLEYRGKTMLPFSYSQIKSIQLLVAEN